MKKWIFIAAAAAAAVAVGVSYVKRANPPKQVEKKEVNIFTLQEHSSSMYTYIYDPEPEATGNKIPSVVWSRKSPPSPEVLRFVDRIFR